MVLLASSCLVDQGLAQIAFGPVRPSYQVFRPAYVSSLREAIVQEFDCKRIAGLNLSRIVQRQVLASTVDLHHFPRQFGRGSEGICEFRSVLFRREFEDMGRATFPNDPVQFVLNRFA